MNRGFGSSWRRAGGLSCVCAASVLRLLIACGDDADAGESQDASLSDGGASADAGRSPADAGEGDSGVTDAAGEEPSDPAADWELMGYDVGSTYNNAHETVLSRENAAQLEEAWTVDMGGNVYGAPLQVGEVIYASGAQDVRALDADSGEQLWSVAVGSTASMAHADGVLYIHKRGGEVVALNAADGEQLWAQQSDTQRGDGSASPIVAGDVVLVGGSNGGVELLGGSFRGFLSALDRMSGEIVWTTHTVPAEANGASIWSSAAADLAAGMAYASTGNNYGAPATDTSDAILAFDLASGEIVWKNQRTEADTFSGANRAGGPDYDFGANPVLYETEVDGVMTRLVSAGAKSGAAHAMRRDDGTLLWTRELCAGSTNGSRGIFVNSTWTGRDMLFACNEETTATLYALDGASGDITWQRSLPGLVWGRMSVANGVGFVGTGTSLEVFETENGDVIKAFPSKGGTVAGTITIANGRVAYGEGLSWASGVRGSTLTVLKVQ